MPYTHCYDFSIHAYRKCPKYGNHYRRVQREQRPWKIMFVVLVLVGLGYLLFYFGIANPIQGT